MTGFPSCVYVTHVASDRPVNQLNHSGETSSDQLFARSQAATLESNGLYLICHLFSKIFHVFVFSLFIFLSEWKQLQWLHP